MIVAPLGSGSAGNSYFFESDGTAILIDAGFGSRETKRRLEAVGGDIAHVRALVITHEHYDHIRGAESVAKKLKIPIYLTRGTLEASTLDPEVTPVVVFENNTSFQIGELLVHARRIIHDAADPACFVVEGRDGTRVGLASDLGYVDPPVVSHLRDCDGLLFESNHDVDMLRTGSYPWSLKRRILSRFGHLSNDEAMIALRRMFGDQLQTLCLIHLSQKNNHESIVREMAEETVDRCGLQLELSIAQQFEPTARFEIARRRPQPPPRRATPQLALF